MDLAALAPESLFTISSRVASYALDKTDLDDPRVVVGLSRLNARAFGEKAVLEPLHALTAELDEQAWALQELAVPGSEHEGLYRSLFAQARAVSSLWFALGDDRYLSSVECVYEAQAAVGLDDIRRIIGDSLSSDPQHDGGVS